MAVGTGGRRLLPISVAARAQSPLAYYGAQGGRSFYVSADLESQSITSSSETRFALSLRRNDPETLALFPYAQNALGLYMQVSGGWK